MEATLLQTIGNLIVLLVFIGLPLLLVIKNPQTTLSLVKTGLMSLVSAGKFIAPFIVSFITWVYKTFTNDAEPVKRSSDDGFETPVVNKVRTYQNGVDGPKRVPGTTFYH